jgi:hypothetical protein
VETLLEARYELEGLTISLEGAAVTKVAAAIAEMMKVVNCILEDEFVLKCDLCE